MYKSKLIDIVGNVLSLNRNSEDTGMDVGDLVEGVLEGEDVDVRVSDTKEG